MSSIEVRIHQGGMERYVAISAPAGAAGSHEQHVCKQTGAIMLYITFELADGKPLTWLMERTHTIRHVKLDMILNGEEDRDLFINGDRLDDDMTFNDVCTLVICKKVKTVEVILEHAKLQLKKIEDLVMEIRGAALSTIPHEPTTTPEGERTADEGSRNRSRSPRRRLDAASPRRRSDEDPVSGIDPQS